MISVVVPNFNSGNLLARNLPRLTELLEKSKLEYETIVTDDASTDNSIEVIRSLVTSHLSLVTSKINTGFGTNVDRGIRQAKGEVVFVLNAIDALPESADYFKLVLEHFEDTKVFSVAAAKKDTETHGCGEVYFEKGFFLHRRGNPDSQVSAWADGGAQALRKEYYLKIGGFDPIYKFYWEDVDLGWRAWKAGYKIIFEPEAVLIHHKEGGPIAKFYTERQKRIMNLRNQFIFTWKNADLKRLLLYGLWEPYHMAVAVKNGDQEWFAAYFQALAKWPTILERRIFQKGLTKLTDDQALKI